MILNSECTTTAAFITVTTEFTVLSQDEHATYPVLGDSYWPTSYLTGAKAALTAQNRAVNSIKLARGPASELVSETNSNRQPGRAVQ